jgi:hypothetical protein
MQCQFSHNDKWGHDVAVVIAMKWSGVQHTDVVVVVIAMKWCGVQHTDVVVVVIAMRWCGVQLCTRCTLNCL